MFQNHSIYLKTKKNLFKPKTNRKSTPLKLIYNEIEKEISNDFVLRLRNSNSWKQQFCVAIRFFSLIYDWFSFSDVFWWRELGLYFESVGILVHKLKLLIIYVLEKILVMFINVGGYFL